jgi:hypothetical protein
MDPRSPIACRGIHLPARVSLHLERRASSWQSPDQVRLENDALKLHTHSHRRSVMERFDIAVTNGLQS